MTTQGVGEYAAVVPAVQRLRRMPRCRYSRQEGRGACTGAECSSRARWSVWRQEAGCEMARSKEIQLGKREAKRGENQCGNVSLKGQVKRKQHKLTQTCRVLRQQLVAAPKQQERMRCCFVLGAPSLSAAAGDRCCCCRSHPTLRHPPLRAAPAEPGPAAAPRLAALLAALQPAAAAGPAASAPGAVLQFGPG